MHLRNADAWNAASAAAAAEDKTGHDLVTVNIERHFQQYDIAGATIVSQGDSQRDWIRTLTGISASCRQRGGWHCKQLTLSGPPEADFPEAKRLALLAIEANYKAGVTGASGQRPKALMKSQPKAKPRKSALPPVAARPPPIPWGVMQAQNINQANQMYSPPQSRR